MTKLSYKHWLIGESKQCPGTECLLALRTYFVRWWHQLDQRGNISSNDEAMVKKTLGFSPLDMGGGLKSVRIFIFLPNLNLFCYLKNSRSNPYNLAWKSCTIWHIYDILRYKNSKSDKDGTTDHSVYDLQNLGEAWNVSGIVAGLWSLDYRVVA